MLKVVWADASGFVLEMEADGQSFESSGGSSMHRGTYGRIFSLIGVKKRIL